MKVFRKNMLGVFIGIAAITNIEAKALDRIPVHYIVAADSKNGTGTQASLSDLDKGILRLNSYFNELGIEFYRDKITYITNSDISGINDPDWDTHDEEKVRPWFDYGKMNIIVASLDGSNGHAYWDYEQSDVIEIEPSRLDSSTIAHEVGHNFSLKHTYQSWDENSISVMEGPNGYKYGDNVIDTPVDPGERENFTNCLWTGRKVDNDGQAYAPDGFNIMGKGDAVCRDSFSDEQRKRLQRVVQTAKFHLFDKYGSNQNPSCANSPKVTSFPNREGFNYEGTVSSTPWVQDVFNDDDFNWKIDADTSSSETGASSSQAGQNFVHIDSGHEFLSPADQVTLLSPCYDLSNQNMAEVDFYYHMYGADIGKLMLEVTLDNGVSWVGLWNKENQQQASSEEAWSKATVNLDNYLDKSIQLRLKGEVIGGSKGDISIDTITFRTAVVGDRPVITDQHDLTTDEDQSITLSITDFTYAEEVNVDSLVILSGENYQVDEQKITPNNNFNGILTVEVSSINNGSSSELFSAIVIVNSVNDTPTVMNDSMTVVQGSAENIIDVISNDTDVDGDLLVLSQVNYTGSGSVIISDNKLVYTPASGFSGTENLTYVVNDSNNGVASGSLTLTITAKVSTENSNSVNSNESSGGIVYYFSLLLIAGVGRLLTKNK